MGTYNKWFVSVNTSDHKVIETIKKYGQKIEDTGAADHWDAFCFRKWSYSCKWNPSSLLMKLSKRFDTLIFSANYQGDYGTGKTFFYQGEEIEESMVFKANPVFPTVTLIKKALDTRNEKMLIKQIAEEKASAAKAFEEKQKRIKELETELMGLKK